MIITNQVLNFALLLHSLVFDALDVTGRMLYIRMHIFHNKHVSAANRHRPMASKYKQRGESRLELLRSGL